MEFYLCMRGISSSSLLTVSVLFKRTGLTKKAFIRLHKGFRTHKGYLRQLKIQRCCFMGLGQSIDTNIQHLIYLL